MTKLLRRLHAKKRVSMFEVSARLGVNLDTDKPAILARSSAKPAPARYAFPVSSTENSGKPVDLLPEAGVSGNVDCYACDLSHAMAF